MVDGLYDASFPRGQRMEREPTYLERELGIRGDLTVGFGAVKDKLTITVRGETLEIECICPLYTKTVALGCPLHHPGGPGGSWMVEDLKAKMT